MPANFSVTLDGSGNPISKTNPLQTAHADVRATAQALVATSTSNSYSVVVVDGQGAVGFAVTGLTASGATLIPEASNDGGTTWATVNAILPGNGGLTQSLTVDGMARVNAGGHTNVRLRVSIVGTGTITIASNVVSGNPLIALSNALPQGTNAIGSVTSTSFALTNSAAVTVPTAGTAAIVVPFSSTRKFVTVYYRSSSNEVADIGSSNVVAGSGIPLTGGSGVTFSGAGAAGPIYGVSSIATAPFSYVEG